MRVAGWMVAVLLGAAVGCADSRVQKIEMEELCPRIAAALCAGRTHCCAEIPLGFRFPTEAECPEWVEEDCRQLIMSADPMSPLPEMDFDKVAAARLVADFEAASGSCEDPPALWSVEALLSVNKYPGDACHYGPECPTGTACVLKDATSSERRVCKARASQEVGAACKHNGDCAPHLGCVLSDGVEIGVCRNSDLGEACALVPCLPELACQQDLLGSGSPLCVQPGAVGAPCPSVGLSGCGDGLYCDTSVAENSTGHCAEKHNTGDPCNGSDECASNVCDNVQLDDTHCAECTEAWCRGGTCVDGACQPNPPSPPTWPPYRAYSDFQDWCSVGSFGGAV